MTYPNTSLFIDDDWVDAADERTIPVHNPATGQEIGSVAHATASDLDRALAAAQRGFEIWRDYTPAKRGKIMRLGVGAPFPFVHIVKREDPDNHQRLYFGKALAYSIAAAPFVRLFGLNGLLLFHVMLLALAAAAGGVA